MYYVNLQIHKLQEMLLSVIKLLIDDAFEIDCSIPRGSENVVKARYAYFYFCETFSTNNQNQIAEFIGRNRSTIPYGVSIFHIFMNKIDYKDKIQRLEQQIHFIKNHEKIMLQSKKYDCLCRVIPEGPSFSRLERNRDYKFIVIDDEGINWKPFMIVFIDDENYLSFTSIGFKKHFEKFTIKNY